MNDAKTAPNRSPAAADLGRKVVNFFGFDTVWLITVLGSAQGRSWPGLLAFSAFAIMHVRLFPAPKSDFMLMGVMCAIGLLFDSALVRSGLLVVTTGWPFPGIAPLWMLVLWANLALAINHCLGWLHGRYWLAALFGTVGGPLAYIGGGALGAATFSTSLTTAALVIGLFWAGVTPLLFWLAAGLNRRLRSDATGSG